MKEDIVFGVNPVGVCVGISSSLQLYLVKGLIDYSTALKKWGYIGFGLSVNLSVHHNLVSAQYLENSFIEFNKILYIDMIYIGINVTQHFSNICTRVMALDLLQNFVSAQYF